MLDSHYFAKSVQKVWRQHQYDDPQDPAFAGVSPWAEWLAQHPVLARLMFAPGFILEIAAFLMLWNRRWAAMFGVALVVMHFFIGIIMLLHFPEYQVMVLIFCVNVPFVIAWALRRHRSVARPYC
jgi:hypothetical protein